MVKRNNIPLLILVFCLLHGSTLWAGWFNQGYRLYMQKKYDAARDIFIKAAEEGNSGDAYYFLGEIEKNEGNYDKATEYYQLAVKNHISKRFLRFAYWNLIILTEKKGNYPELVRSLKLFWQRTGDHAARKKVETIINKLMWSENEEATEEYQNGVHAKNKGKKTAAVEHFNKALQLDPKFLAPQFEIGMIQYRQGDISSARAALSAVIDKIPFYGEVHLLLGEINYKSKNHAEAIGNFSGAIEFGFLDRETEYDIRIKRGMLYYNQKDYAKARIDFIRARELNPKSTSLALLLSSICIKNKKYDEALQTLNAAKKYAPKNREIMYQIGSIYYKKNDTAWSRYFSILFNLCADDKAIPARYCRAFKLLAEKKYQDSRFSDVVAIMDVLPKDQADEKIRLLAAKSNYFLGQYDEAITYLEKNAPGENDKYILAKAYVKNDLRDKAKMTLAGLYGTALFKRALADSALKRIAREIVNEKEKRRE